MSVHEAYPGHYVHYLHTRNADSMMSRVFGAYSFWEGWAHYAEQVMVEAGYLAEPRNELGQLTEALLPGLPLHLRHQDAHAGHDVAEATRFFNGERFHGGAAGEEKRRCGGLSTRCT